MICLPCASCGAGNTHTCEETKTIRKLKWGFSPAQESYEAPLISLVDSLTSCYFPFSFSQEFIYIFHRGYKSL